MNTPIEVLTNDECTSIKALDYSAFKAVYITALKQLLKEGTDPVSNLRLADKMADLDALQPEFVARIDNET